MAKAAVVIGVDRVTGLTPLRAAAKGVQDVAAWASAQGFEVHPFSDGDGATVAIAPIKATLRSLVERGDLEQLVIYFAGHGILRAPECELWLLSGAPDDPNEAVNLAGTIALARYAGVPYIVFISDACRSRPDTMLFAQMEGAVIFPNRTARPPLPPIDVFYAALPGSPSLEVPPDEAVASYRGLFTDHLLRGLRGEVASVIEDRLDHGRMIWTVPAWTLEPYLETEVPLAAARINIKLLQHPDVRAESRPPKYLSLLTGPLPAARHTPAPAAPPPPKGGGLPGVGGVIDRLGELVGQAGDWVTSRRSPGETEDAVAEVEPVVAPPSRSDRTDTIAGQIFAAAGQILAARGRESFETQTGFTIAGASVTHALTPRGQCDVFTDAGAQQIRVYKREGDPWPRSLLVRFEDGTGTCLAVAHGAIGTIVVQEGRLITVNYTPSRNHWSYQEYEPYRDEIDHRRALVAAAAEQGVFRIEPGRAVEYAALLRRFKRFDLTLGLYAAYAYAQAGNVEQVQSIHDYMQQDPSPVPFDVAVLAGRLMPPDVLEAETGVAPFCPMLTQGWMFLEPYRELLPLRVRQAGRHLVPALWTTFDGRGMDLLLEAVERGEVG